jgi:hypothetical protein
MATAESRNTTSITSSINFHHIDIPSDREYENAEDAEFDEAMVEAIKKARKAEVIPTAEVLEYQLGSHYLDSQ